MYLPHHGPNGLTTLPLGKMLPIPSSIAVSPRFPERTAVFPDYGIVHHIAVEELSGCAASQACSSSLSLGVRSVGPFATGIALRLLQAEQDGVNQFEAPASELRPVKLLAMVSVFAMPEERRTILRDAFCKGFPLCFVVSSLRNGVAISVREHRLSEQMAGAIRSDLDRQLKNDGPQTDWDFRARVAGAREQVVKNDALFDDLLCWEENVPVTFHRSRNRTGR